MAEPARKRVDRGARYWAITWFKDGLTEPLGADSTTTGVPPPYPEPLKEDFFGEFGKLKGKYCVYQLEKCPETGRLHLQMFLQFDNQIRLSTIKDLCPGAHAEPCKAAEKNNERYCSKEASRLAGPWTYGVKVTKGQRTDWDHVKEMAEAGNKCREIVLAHPKLAPCVKGINVIIDCVRGPAPTMRDVRVFFLWGETGVGKTHRARNKYPDAYVTHGKYYEGKSFDGYDGEDTLIMDEWRWDEWPLTLVNTLLDKFSCTLQCRYYNRQARWTRVIILSNQQPSDCYPALSQTNKDTFLRRLNTVVNVISKEQQIEDFDF